MLKQQNYLAIGAVVIVTVLLLSLPTHVTVRLKHAVGSWFWPLFGLAGAARQLPADLADSTLPRRELHRPHLVEKHEGADGAPLRDGQQAHDLEPADIPRARCDRELDRAFQAHVRSPSQIGRVASASHAFAGSSMVGLRV